MSVAIARFLTAGKLLPHKWENCMTIDKYSWGFRRNARLQDIHTMDELIQQLVRTVRLVWCSFYLSSGSHRLLFHETCACCLLFNVRTRGQGIDDFMNIGHQYGALS